MPAPDARHIPTYRKHSSRNVARVTLGGRTVYLPGPFGSAESRAAYDRTVAEWLAGGRPTRRTRPGAVRDPSAHQAGKGESGPKVVELIAAFWTYCEGYYVKDGAPTTEQTTMKSALRRLRRLYGDTPIAEFGPASLKTLRHDMIVATDSGAGDDVGADGRAGTTLARSTANKYIARIRQCFKWGVSEGLVPSNVWWSLCAVSALKRGRSEAREAPGVGPVRDATVEQTLGFLRPVLADMVRVQRLTGMRPQELCAMTTAEIDTSSEVWFYRPSRHKNQHHGKVREIPIGPRAQAVLTRYLRPELHLPLFSPTDAELQRSTIRRAGRRTPLRAGDASRRRGNKRNRPPGEAYTTDSYRRAIARACAHAFPHPSLATEPQPVLAHPSCNEAPTPPPTSAAPAQRVDAAELRRWNAAHRWHPNQLRHTFASVNRPRGIDLVGAALGHSRIETTQVYAERSREMAAALAKQVG
jgi:integrase